MVSLNDLDAEIGDLECSSSDDSEPSPPPPLKVGKKKPKAKIKVKKKKRSSENDSGSEHSSSKVKKRKIDGEKNNGVEVAGPLSKEDKAAKKRKERNVRDAVCFRYLKGACHFDDCKFQHVNPKKLTTEEQAQILRELSVRTFDPQLAEVIQDLNIPKCKDFHQRGGCSRPGGKCHFWHLTSGIIARWAGFSHWCDICSKGFTSQDQMEDHEKAKPHLAAAAAQGRTGRWERTDFSVSKGRGRGVVEGGRGYGGRSNASGRGGGRGRGNF